MWLSLPKSLVKMVGKRGACTGWRALSTMILLCAIFASATMQWRLCVCAWWAKTREKMPLSLWDMARYGRSMKWSQAVVALSRFRSRTTTFRENSIHNMVHNIDWGWINCELMIKYDSKWLSSLHKNSFSLWLDCGTLGFSFTECNPNSPHSLPSCCEDACCWLCVECTLCTWNKE